MNRNVVATNTAAVYLVANIVESQLKLSLRFNFYMSFQKKTKNKKRIKDFLHFKSTLIHMHYVLSRITNINTQVGCFNKTDTSIAYTCLHQCVCNEKHATVDYLGNTLVMRGLTK